MSNRFELRAAKDIREGDVIVISAANHAERAAVVHIQRGSYVVLSYRTASRTIRGAYTRLEPTDSVTVDTLPYPVPTALELERTLYSGSLAYRITDSGYMAVRILDINLERGTADIEVTARKPAAGYSTGEVEHSVPFSSLAHRGAVYREAYAYRELYRPRFSARYIDYLGTARGVERATARGESVQ